MTETPLPLPKFTFLCAPVDAFGQNELCAELQRLDPDLAPFDFHEPLRMAMHQLFCGGYTGEPLPDLIEDTGQNVSTRAVMDDLETLLQNFMGGSALGHIAVRSYLRDGEIYSRLVYRDAESSADIRPFASRFGGKNCLCIHLDRLVNGASCGPDVKHIWLQASDLPSRIVALRRELEPVR